MKVLAKIKEVDLNRYVLVEMTENELANIMGEYSHYDIPIDKLVKEGTDIQISQIYEQYNIYRNILKLADYDKARRKLEDMLKALTPIEGLLNNDKLNINK